MKIKFARSHSTWDVLLAITYIPSWKYISFSWLNLIMLIEWLNAWRMKRCPECGDERNRKGGYIKADRDEPELIGIPGVDLVTAIIRRAILDGRNVDAEAREFLRAEDGAEMYLRLAGVELNNKLRKQLYWIGKHRVVKFPDNWRTYDEKGGE